MKTLVTAIALTAALSTPVFAGSDHEHGHEMQGSEMQGGMMMDMHEHMQEMGKIMAKIKKE